MGRKLLPPPPDRHSRGWRRRSAGLLLLVVLLGACGYAYLTRQARLVSIAQAFLEDLSGGQVDISRVDFSFFGGIHVTGLTVRTPAEYEFGPPEGPARVIFHAADVNLRHRPLSLLVGRFDVEKIVALRPEFVFITDKATGRSNWQSLRTRPSSGKSGGKPRPLPRIELRHCVLRSGLLDGTALQLAEPLEMDLVGTAMPSNDRAYTCLLQPLGADRLPRTLRVDLEKKAVSGDLPGIQIAQLQLSLPAEYARWCEILELSGQIGAEDIEFDLEHNRRCTINLSHVSLSVPFDESEFHGADVRAGRMVRLHEVVGRIVFEPREVRVEISGLLNGRRMRVWGTFQDYTGPLKAMGYDLHIETARLPLPDSRDPRTVSQIAKLGKRVLKLFHEFDPTAGTFSVQGRLVRPPGENAPSKFRGTIETFDGAARYDDFPYHARNARSTIRLTDDGIFFDIIARRGPGLFHVKGWVDDGSSHTDADVTVDAVSVPLDEELYNTLPPKIRKLWGHFDFLGLISCKFRIWRKGGTPESGAAPWHWNMDMTLHDVAARYEGFPVMQWGINGKLQAADGFMSRIDLTAVNLDAVTRILGTADLRDQHKAVDLRILAKNRRLTADLLPALPQQVRDLVAAAAVKGLFDVDATVKMSAETDNELLCRADVHWHDGSVLPRQFAYPLTDVDGRIRLDQATRRAEILEWSARNGQARFHAAGSMDLREKPSGQFQLSADDLPLDDALYAALPESLQRWWRDFDPKGSLGVRSELTLSPGASGTNLSHRTSLLLAGNQACWESFPLPLREINGKVVISPGRCEVQDLTAVHEEGLVRLDGAIDWDDDTTRADMKVSAKNIALNEPLRLAVPGQMRRIWNTWQPAGRIDLDLPTLRYVKPRQGGGVWDLEGDLAAKLQKLDMSVEVTDAVLRSSLTAHVDEAAETFDARGKLHAEQAVLSMIPLADIRGDWSRSADGSFRLRDLQAKTLGGTLAGFCELVPVRRGERYGMVLSLDHADPGQLAEILTGGQMSGVTGSIQMQMRLRGLVDQPETRSGAAECQLTGQGLYRLPVLLQIANVLNIPLTGEPRDTQQLSTRVTIMGNQAILDSLELRDSAFLMLGTGQIDIPTRQASLTVIAARPRTWPKVPVLTELLEAAVRELVEVHGYGPLNNLKFEGRPLRSVQAALQTLATRKHEAGKQEQTSKTMD